MKTVKQIFKITYLTIFYKVFYSSEKQGYMIRKRVIPFIIIAPISVPFLMICAFFDYINYIFEYRSAWIETGKKKLSFKERLSIKLNLQ